MQAKTIDEAIQKGAFMLYGSDWAVIKSFDEQAIEQAVMLAINDSWNEMLQDELGNGFLGIPNDRTNEIAKKYPEPTAAIYRIIMRSNIAARKSYIKNNQKLNKAIRSVLGVSA